MTTRVARKTARTAVTTTTVVALALAGVVLPTVSLPVPEAHAVAPDVEHVPVRGIDADARQQKGALDDAVGHEHVAPEKSELAKEIAPDGAAAALTQNEPDEGDLAALSERTATQDFLVAGVTWDEATGSEVTEVAVRVREDGRWSDWQSLGLDGVTVDGGRAGTEPIVSTGADGVQARVRTADGTPPSGLQVDVVDPGTSRADANVGQDSDPAASAGAGTGFEIRPSVVTRSGWGADESLSGSWPETSKALKAIYVHHTAGTNSYRESQSAALVRGIYAYHTKSRGWPDIGYQFLVDKYGNIFQGRKDARVDNPIGAQAGGYNTGTIGVSAMGNFDTARPTSALLTAMAKVIAWKSYQYRIDPKGTTTLLTGGSTGSGTRAKPGTKVRVPTVLMHRTTNETACPGRYLAEKMGTLRNGAASRKAAAIKKYGSMRWAVAAPTRYAPSAAQYPVQWSTKATYKWKKVSGARYYQVLYRDAHWSSDMPSTNYWRVLRSATTATSVTVNLDRGTAREIAVRAVGQKYHRGPMTTLVRTSTTIMPKSWSFSSGWKKVNHTIYYGDYAYQTATGGKTISLKSANQVRRVVLRGPTNPADGKLQVLVAGKVRATLDFGKPRDGDRVFTVTLPDHTDGTVTLRKVSDGKKVRISQISLARW
ncbi:peptidoglycan recognition protein family protein [Krasilnikoviella flava]|uniref:N-acetylmuramoyl-L-alanine amidase n=1 Tax=Krasilnikoviella flava TaxID=526729 RepID=A0A1T5IAY0_9MICO|nr:peptidoglycan recognition protein [Krasilnikoviella flava]SKC36112.1 N-acetylmuramoyl-L-alanine amidase [Krasilnikoviella flava]